MVEVIRKGPSSPFERRRKRHEATKSLVYIAALGAYVFVSGPGCAARTPSADDLTTERSRLMGPSAGHIVFLGQDEHIHRIEAREGAQPVDLSNALNRHSPGADRWAGLSPDGQWLALLTSRFGCGTDRCVVLLKTDLSHHAMLEGVKAHAVPSSGGQKVVFVGAGPHVEDLYVIQKDAQGWSKPLLLTGSSKHQYNNEPALSQDGRKVVFACADAPYALHETEICEVNTDGTRLTVSIPYVDGTSSDAGLRSPDYAPDGSIVFEGEDVYDWTRERVARRPASGGKPRVLGVFGNDNSPCVLPNGWIASLWLTRPGNPEGLHELKVMSPDGEDYFMLMPGNDIKDVGLGCGE